MQHISEVLKGEKYRKLQQTEVESLQEKLESEWRKMHHNASITWPELKNEYESEMFWDCLNDYVGIWIRDLQEYIEEKYGRKMTFYQYGRQGATIAPDEYMNGSTSFGSLKYEVDENDIEGAIEMLEIFRHINEYWRGIAKQIPAWWQSVKDDNDYQKDIDDHEGMKKIMVPKWIKAK